MLRKLLLSGLLTALACASAVRISAFSIVEIVARAKPCIVIITSYNSETDESGQGTGFFIDNDKFLTDAHVIPDNGLKVEDLYGNRIYTTGETVYYNDRKHVDLAILQTRDSAPHPYLSFSPEIPREGQTITVIGNPLGLTGTVSTGIIAALREHGNIVQFTAPISSGSSGGPLLDDERRVVGIVDWVLKPKGESIAQNLNFAYGLPPQKMAVAQQQTAAPTVQATPAPNSAAPSSQKLVMAVDGMIANHDWQNLTRFTVDVFGQPKVILVKEQKSE
jgi:S1-C subfamily serine protease